jgi:hypothetical protein
MRWTAKAFTSSSSLPGSNVPKGKQGPLDKTTPELGMLQEPHELARDGFATIPTAGSAENPWSGTLEVLNLPRG